MRLGELITKAYLDEKVIASMQKVFQQDGMVLRLDEFFDVLSFETLVDELESLKGVKKKIADRHSYEEIRFDDLSGVFSGNQFLDFCKIISGENIEKATLKIKKFGHKDYTLLHDSLKKNSGLEFFMIFCDFWDDEFGGQIVFSDTEGENLVFSVKGNTFVLINLKNRGRFVKYVNHLAGKKNFFLVEGKLE